MVVTDKLQTSGAELKKGSIRVYLNNQKLNNTEISETTSGFTVKTHTDVKENDRLKITYEVNFKSASLKGKRVENLAEATADNGKKDDMVYQVSVEGDDAGSNKTDTPKDSKNSTTFKSGVKTGDAAPVKLLVILGVTGVLGIAAYFLGKKKGKK